MLTDAITTQILIVDDSPTVSEPLSHFLRLQGFRTRLADNAAQARRLLDEVPVHLVLLDIMMPGEDGLSLCRYIVREKHIPVILLTARIGEEDRIAGIELGADDYVTKPFSLRELGARIRGILRRVPPTQPVPDRKCYRFGGLLFDASTNRVTLRDGKAVLLSSGQGRLLSALLSRPDETITRTQLLTLVRSRQLKPYDRTVDNIVSRLRRKLADNSAAPHLIITVWGGGYRIGVPVVEE